MQRSIKEWQREVFEVAKSKGWHDRGHDPWRMNSLIHSEISEAAQEMREPGFQPTRIYYSDDGKPEGMPIEYADAVIRIMEKCEAFGIDLEAAMDEKNAFNKTRPYRHGGKIA